MMTSNIHLLEIKRVEILALEVRGNLANLRRLKLTRGSALAGQRNPALDGLFDGMIEMRRDLLNEIAVLDADPDPAHLGRQISGIAGQVLGDIDEMIELLICLGAAQPGDRENWQGQNSV
jgi:hypothetical protein